MKDSKKEFSDEELINGLKSEQPGQRDRAMEYLYIRNFPVIRNFIMKNSGSEEDAADIFQNAMIAFYEKVRYKQLELNCTIRTFLYSICRNLWFDELRAQKKQQKMVSDLKVVAVESEDMAVLEPDDQTKLVSKLMSQLGTDCNRILGLFYFERFSMKQIAAEMGYANEKVAKNLKARCMKKLKAIANQSSS